MTRLTNILTGTLAALSTISTAAAGAVTDLTPKNFDSIVLQSQKPALVEFFAPWCGHCKTLAPTYEELATSFAHATDKVTIAKVDADAHRDLARRFGVQGFPTIKWFDGKSEKAEEYASGRDLDSLVGFVSGKTGIRAKGQGMKEPSLVVNLGDRSFGEVVGGGGKDVLVAFTAPWCGYCKKLAPVWESLAKTFSQEPNILIAKVEESEPTKQTLKDQSISSYPTIKFFPRGKGTKNPEPYTQGREEKDLVNYINAKTGTQRVPGGGLNEHAGVIPALDTVVAKHLSAGSLGELVGEVKKTAEGLKKEGAEKYAEYYVRVAGKVAESEEYAGKELGRLERILKKGGSAPEKVDDLVSRSNVLRRFTGLAGERKDEL